MNNGKKYHDMIEKKLRDDFPRKFVLKNLEERFNKIMGVKNALRTSCKDSLLKNAVFIVSFISTERDAVLEKIKNEDDELTEDGKDRLIKNIAFCCKVNWQIECIISLLEEKGVKYES